MSGQIDTSHSLPPQDPTDLGGRKPLIKVVRGDERTVIFAESLGEYMAQGWKPADEVTIEGADALGSRTVVSPDELQERSYRGTAGSLVSNEQQAREHAIELDAENTRRYYEDFGWTSGIMGFGDMLGGKILREAIIGPDDEFINNIKKHNKTENIVGSVLGVATSLGLGPAGLASKAATGGKVIGTGAQVLRHTPIGLAERAGRATYGLAGGGARGMVAAGAVEGAAFAGLNTLATQLVSDEEFSAEALLSEIGSGALWGGAIGGAISGVASGVGAVRSKIRGMGNKAPPTEAAAAIQAKMDEAEAAFRRNIDFLDSPDQKKLDSLLSDHAALDKSTATLFNRLKSKKTGPAVASDLGLTAADRKKLLSEVKEAKAKLHSMRGVLYRKRENPNDLLKLDNDDVVTLKAGIEAADELPQLAKRLGATEDEILKYHERARAASDNINTLYASQLEEIQKLGAMKATKAADVVGDAAAARSVQTSDSYKAALREKLEAEHAKTLERYERDMARELEDATGKPGAVGWITDKLRAVAAPVLGGAVAGPPGMLIGAMMRGGGFKSRGKYVKQGPRGRRTGEQYSAGTTSSSGGITWSDVARTGGSAKERLRIGIKTMLSGAPPAGKVGAARTAAVSIGATLRGFSWSSEQKSSPKGMTSLQRDYNRALRSLQDAASRPRFGEMRLKGNSPEIAVSRPTLLDALASKAQARIQYLLSKAPKPPSSNPFLRGDDKHKYVSSEKIAEFAATLRIAEDPMAIFEDAVHGTVTPSAVETFKTLYPKLYHESRMELINELPNIAESLDYKRRFQLWMLYGVPTDISLTREALASSASPPRQQGAGAPQNGGASVPTGDSLRNIKPQELSGSQRMMMR